jgi:hypothetical protein
MRIAYPDTRVPFHHDRIRTMTTTLTTSTRLSTRFIKASLALCAVHFAATGARAVPLIDEGSLVHWTTADTGQFGGSSTSATTRAPTASFGTGYSSGLEIPSGDLTRSGTSNRTSELPVVSTGIGSGAGIHTPWSPPPITNWDNRGAFDFGRPDIHLPPPNRALDAPDGGSTVILLGCGLLALFVLRRRALI